MSSINLPLALAMIVAGTTLGEAIVLMVDTVREGKRPPEKPPTKEVR